MALAVVVRVSLLRWWRSRPLRLESTIFAHDGAVVEVSATMIGGDLWSRRRARRLWREHVEKLNTPSTALPRDTTVD
jgi:hypothetical protein